MLSIKSNLIFGIRGVLLLAAFIVELEKISYKPLGKPIGSRDFVASEFLRGMNTPRISNIKMAF